MTIYGGDIQVDHPDASGRECLFQHGKGDNNIFFVGETSSCVREKVLLLEANTDSTSHINTFSRVFSKVSSQGINFEEEVKALALSSLPVSWEVFCTTFTNNYPNLN